MDVERIIDEIERSSSYRKCSKRRILGHSAQATSLLPIEGTMKCSRTARGSEFGNGMASAAEASPQQSGSGKSKARVPPEFEYSKFSLNLGRKDSCLRTPIHQSECGDQPL